MTRAERNLLKELRRNHWRLASPEARAAHEATLRHRSDKRRVDLTCPTCKRAFTRIGSQIHGKPEDACCSRRCAALHVTARGIRPKPFRARSVQVPVRSAPPPCYEPPPCYTGPSDMVSYWDDVPIGVGVMGSAA